MTKGTVIHEIGYLRILNGETGRIMPLPSFQGIDRAERKVTEVWQGLLGMKALCSGALKNVTLFTPQKS
jgi:hypothetical protein